MNASSSRPKRRADNQAADAVSARIVDTAIEMAEETGWSALRLRDVALRLNMSLAELQRHFRDKDAVADAWFGRAWQALLAAPPEDFFTLPAEQRLHLLIMRWFDALAGHREVTRQMIADKLYPSHLHHWVPMVFNLSRTIHWLRDAAHLDAGGRRRQLEEAGLSALFLLTLREWCRDESQRQERTRAFLARRLAKADRTMTRHWGKADPPGEPA